MPGWLKKLGALYAPYLPGPPLFLELAAIAGSKIQCARFLSSHLMSLRRRDSSPVRADGLLHVDGAPEPHGHLPQHGAARAVVRALPEQPSARARGSVPLPRERAPAG